MVLPFVADRRDVAAADALIAEYGDAAGERAAEHAVRSRDLGNHIHFCRWRQIERLVGVLSLGHAIGTVH